jgi:phage recombination protein Bet
MSNQLMVTMAEKFKVPQAEMMATLKATAFKGQVSDAQMTALLIVANQYNLNPWLKEIYAFPADGGIVPIVGVDGWSRIINENPMFDGMDFEQNDQECTCRIYRKDRSHPIAVTEYMSECKRENVKPWKSHPRRMLRHKAMIQCARIAFGYTGIFDEDEAERIVEKDITPAKDISPALTMIESAKDVDQLQKAWVMIYKEYGANAELTKAKDDKKKEFSLLAQAEVIEADTGFFDGVPAVGEK